MTLGILLSTTAVTFGETSGLGSFKAALNEIVSSGWRGRSLNAPLIWIIIASAVVDSVIIACTLDTLRIVAYRSIVRGMMTLIGDTLVATVFRLLMTGFVVFLYFYTDSDEYRCDLAATTLWLIAATTFVPVTICVGLFFTMLIAKLLIFVGKGAVSSFIERSIDDPKGIIVFSLLAGVFNVLVLLAKAFQQLFSAISERT